MNEVILSGILLDDPEITCAKTNEDMTIARYVLGVQHRGGKQKTIPCVCFNRLAEIAERYFVKGTRLFVHGKIDVGYEVIAGQSIARFRVIVDEQEFAENKASEKTRDTADGYIKIPMAKYQDDELPFD